MTIDDSISNDNGPVPGSCIIPDLDSGCDLIINSSNTDNNVKNLAQQLKACIQSKENNGITLIVTNPSKLSVLSETVESLGLPAVELPQDTEATSAIFYGSVESGYSFFENGMSNAKSIARIIFDVVKPEDVDLIRMILSHSSKRTKRTQLVLFTSGNSEATINEISQGFFQLSTIGNAKHYFCETGLEVLDKLNALVDFIESEGFPKTLVFCNMPSDTDLVEAMLRKKGIAARKLIGNVHPQKIAQSMSLISSKSLTAVIATDIAARNLDSGEFDLVINYSVHSDPEIYIDRTATASGCLKKVISLVGPLDRTNFHYLKKVVENNIEKIDLPEKKNSFQSRLNLLIANAEKNAANISDSAKEIASLIFAHTEKESLLYYLVNSYLNYGIQGELDSLLNSYQEDDRQSGSRFRRGRGDRRQGRDDFEEKLERASRSVNATTLIRTTRVYLGKGKENGLKEEKILSFIKENLPDVTCERMSLRHSYSFLDFEEKSSASFIDAVKEQKPFGDIVIEKAITINHRKDKDEKGREAAEEIGSEIVPA